MKLQTMPNACQFDSHNCKKKLKAACMRGVRTWCRFVCHTEQGGE